MKTIKNERCGQYRMKRRAQKIARTETLVTGIKHYAMLTTTYRNLEPHMCWTVLLWQGKKIALSRI